MAMMRSRSVLRSRALTSRTGGSRSAKAFRRTTTPLVLVMLLALLAAGPAGAQLPEPHPSEPQYKQIALEVETSFVDFPYLGQGSFPFVIRDLSRDSTNQPGVPTGTSVGRPAQTVISVEFEGGSKSGWSAFSTLSAVTLVGGQSERGNLVVQAAGPVRDQHVALYLNATQHLPNGTQLHDSQRVVARVLPFVRALVQVENPSRMVGQYETHTFNVTIYNSGVYPEYFNLNVSAPDGFQVHVPERVYVLPQDTRTVQLTMKTPKDKVFDFGTSTGVTVIASAERNPDAEFRAPISLYVRGAYLPSHWMPTAALGLLCIGLLASQWREKRELKTLEKGKPRRPAPTPRQAVLLKDLKRRDPDAYKERAAIFSGLWAARRAEYRAKRAAAKREEREARRSSRAEQRAAAIAAKARAKEEKEERKRLAAEAREERKEARARRKALLARKKDLEKQRAKLAKRKGKLEAKEAKRRAREEKKQAKVDAKAEKKRAREEKRAARQRRKDGKS